MGGDLRSDVTVVDILGQKIPLRFSNPQEEKKIKSVVRLVNDKIDHLKNGNRSVSTIQLLILASLNLTMDHIDERAQFVNQQRELAETISNLINKIDEKIVKLSNQEN